MMSVQKQNEEPYSIPDAPLLESGQNLKVPDTSPRNAAPASSLSNDIEQPGVSLLSTQDNGNANHPSAEDSDLCAWSSLWRGIEKELEVQGKTAWPSLIGMLLYKFPWLISLHFVGHIGPEEMAAAALASTLCNVTGLSLSVGLSSALSTLTGQARGDLQAKQQEKLQQQLEQQHNQSKLQSQPATFSTTSTTTTSAEDGEPTNERTHLILNNNNPPKKPAPLLPMVYLYRGLFMQLLFVGPIGCWWLTGIVPLLLALGQGAHLSQMTATYLKVLTPGLWSYSINWTLTAWLQSLELADVPAYAAAVGLVLHIPFNLLFIYVLKWGYLGVGVATVLFQIIQPLGISFYMFGTSAGRKRLLKKMAASGIDRTSLSFLQEARLAVFSIKGISQYLGLALPGVVVISEWWASEVAIFLSGRLEPFPDVAIGSMTIYQSINTFCFMFPVAVGIAGSTRIGNLLGAGQATQAAWASYVCMGASLCMGSAMGCLLFFSPHTMFPRFFTPEESVIWETSRVIPLLALYVFADSVQSSFSRTVIGCGKQVWTMPVVVVAYWVVGVPLAYYLAFVRHHGDMNEDGASGIVGLVTGMTCGTWVHMILLGVCVVAPIRWEEEARRAKERVAEHHSH